MPVNMITKVQTVDKIFHILLNLLGHQCGRIRYNSRDESNGKTHYIHIRTIYMYLYLYIYMCVLGFLGAWKLQAYQICTSTTVK